MNQHCSILIIGAGIIGLTVARELLSKGYNDILIIDKETDVGVHASGRNSGVLHSGIYYHGDTNKAKFCQAGSQLMKAFCKTYDLPVYECGKAIVARYASELPTLEMLYERATVNGARVEMISEQKLKSKEPLALTVEQALWSHDSAVVNPKIVMATLKRILVEQGVCFLHDCEFLGLQQEQVAITSCGTVQFDQCLNAAGAYAERVAHHFNIAHEYCSLPFKGIYKRFIPKANQETVNGNIYPVPDLRNPFLGVHFTRSATGDIYVGPTAMPCFGRENYQGIKGLHSEWLTIMARTAVLFCYNAGFRHVALTEPRKYMSEFLYRDAKRLVQHLHRDQLVSSVKVGIRPQLIHWPSKTLVMDFLLKKTPTSFHVLNAISPAFTCAMSMAQHIVNEWMHHPNEVVHV